MFENITRSSDVKSPEKEPEKAPEMSPYDTIIHESTPEELDYACQLNKGLAAFCKSNPAAVGLEMFKKYDVDYTDKGNLIYMDINFDDVYSSKTCVYDMEKIYNLFLKYYHMQDIDCSEKGITSIPKFPNLKVLDCSNNKIKVIPEHLKNLTFLNCSDNELSCFPKLPKLEVLICSNNQFIRFPGFTDLPGKYTDFYNYLKTVRREKFPKLTTFNGGGFEYQLEAQFRKIQRNLNGN